MRDRRRARLYIVIAYLVGALVVFISARLLGQSGGIEKDLALVSTDLALLLLIAGLPILILWWRTVTLSGRAASREGTPTQHRLLLGAGALFNAGSIAAAFVLQSQLQQVSGLAMDQATPSMLDRSGLAVITRRNQQYRNMNDRCSSNGSTPPLAGAFGPENRPRCVTQQWFAAHGVWPLVQIGETPLAAMNARGALPPPGAGGPGARTRLPFCSFPTTAATWSIDARRSGAISSILQLRCQSSNVNH